MTRRGKYLILLLFLIIFLVVIPLVALVNWFTTGLPTGFGRVAVVLEMHGSFPEYPPSISPGIIFGRRIPNLTEITSCIERAADDEQVEALVVRIFPSGAGVAKCEEIREAIHRFKESGKQVVTFSPVLVGHHYLIACASDSIFMPPSGYLMIPGPASSAVFIRGTLEKLGISPNIHRIEDYKSAAEFFTEKERTPESREMAMWLLDDIYSRFVSTVASNRVRGEDTVRTWIDRGLFSPQRALADGLIDGIRYWDQVRDSFNDADIRLVQSTEYMRSASTSGLGPRVAVIHAQGSIVMGESGFDPVSGQIMGSETVIRDLRRARQNNRIRAVILRIDSPGGDALAGEMISREVEITSKEKPVVISMSDVAASGGYEISYRAGHIVAMPGSITGSIGSITGKLNMRGFYNKIGVTKDEIGIGEKALMESDYRDFTDAEWRVLKEEHWEFYRNWIEEIARFRDMRVGAVDSLARGRVWTGYQAVEKGLIDEVGGFDRALEVACELAGIEDPSGVTLVHTPKRVTLLQALLSRGFLEDATSYLIHRALHSGIFPQRGLFIKHVVPGT